VSSRSTPADIADAAAESFSACPDERLKELLQGLVAHLHAFAQEVRLTPAEWARTMEILAETGRFTTETRHEFILWSDALGVSMAVDALDEPREPAATESTVEGPFRAPGSPERPNGASISEQPGGTPLWMHGRVLDLDGAPIADAELDIWQNGPNRLYAVQDPESDEHHLRGRFRTGPDGTYALRAVRPTAYPIPDDGPVGAMLRATGRHPWRPAHIHAAVSAPGHRTVVTHIFDADSEFLDSDAVFAVKPSLIKTFETREASDPERPDDVDGDWTSVEVDFVLDRARTAQPTTAGATRSATSSPSEGLGDAT
jgi:hydroxyquinol 1,2-dioxygenase